MNFTNVMLSGKKKTIEKENVLYDLLFIKFWTGKVNLGSTKS